MDQRAVHLVPTSQPIPPVAGLENRASAGLFQHFFEHSGSVMMLMDPESGVILAANAAAARFYGYSRLQLTGMPIDLLNPMGETATAAARMRALKEENTYFSFQHRLASGELRDVEVYSAPLEIDGSRILYSIIHDVSSHRESERRLVKSEERYRTIFATSQEGIDLYRIADGTILDANPSFERIFGYTRAELLGHRAPDLGLWVDLEERHRLFEELEKTGACRNLETRFRAKSGKIFWGVISSSFVELEGERCVLSMVRDVSDVKLTEEESGMRALYDPLTALANRHLLMERLRKLLTSRSSRAHALLYLDLDHLAAVNEKLGRETGDLLLKEVAQRLTRGVRKSDTVARFGGDEFVVLLEELSDVEQQAALDARLVAEKLLSLVGHPYVLRDKVWKTTASIGVRIFGRERMASNELVDGVSSAMQQAKAEGGNRIAFAPEMFFK